MNKYQVHPVEQQFRDWEKYSNRGHILTKDELGYNIRVIRAKRGFTSKQLAELSGISPAYLSEVERGKSEISLFKVLAICRVFNMSIEELVSGLTTHAEIKRLKRFRDAVVGWREFDWPPNFDRNTAELITENAKYRETAENNARLDELITAPTEERET